MYSKFIESLEIKKLELKKPQGSVFPCVFE